MFEKSWVSYAFTILTAFGQKDLLYTFLMALTGLSEDKNSKSSRRGWEGSLTVWRALLVIFNSDFSLY